MARLDVQAVVRDHLLAALGGVDVRVRVPDPRPATLVVVQRSGGGRQDALLDRAGVHLLVWGPTEADCSALAMRAADAMWALGGAAGFALGISRVVEESLRSDPDPETGGPRWFASYTLTTYKPRGE